MRLLAALGAALMLCGAPSVAQQTPTPAQDWSAPERELMVPVEGGRIWVRVNGNLDAAAEPVIFIHGGPGGTHMGFGGLLSLADERAVILYDQLDSGMSDRPEEPANWRVERFVAELEAIRQALDVERWHVVGHSWGSALALEYAARFPRHTASAVLAGTFISTSRWIEGTNALIRELPEDVAANLVACESDMPPAPDICGPATAAFYAVHNGRADRPAPSPEAWAYHQRYSGDGWNETVYNAMWGPSEFSARGSLVGYDGTPLLSRIDGSRTLFMVGQHDEARIDDVQDFVTLTPGAELAVVPGGSHAFISERPAITEAILRSWLARIDARDGSREETE